jgi:hypothetical protein
MLLKRSSYVTPQAGNNKKKSKTKALKSKT